MQPAAFDQLVPRGHKFRLVENLDEDKWWNGRLLMFEPPRKGQSYVLGVDCSEGVGRDRSVIEVISIGVGKKPDTHVAEFASDWHGAAALAPVVAAIGKLYCDDDGYEAMVTAEANMLGQVCLQDLRTIHNYTNLYVRRQYDRISQVWIDKLGFVTNRQTRPALIARGLHAIQEGHLVPTSEFLLQEMEDFEGDWNVATARAKAGQHDDRVIAFMLAYWGAHEEQWTAGEDPLETFQRLTAAEELAKTEKKKSGRTPNWQNTAITLEEMAAQWDNWMDD